MKRCTAAMALALLSACSAPAVQENPAPSVSPASAPEIIHLIPDHYRLTDAGVLATGNLYWIDIQLRANPAGPTRDYVCLYVFGPDGDLLSYEIVDLGLRSQDQIRPSTIIEELMQSLPGPLERDIWVRPFTIEHHETRFGLEVREQDGHYLVDALPGWTLMFYAPWEAGQYDT